jgi:CRP/FNR family cyclic AMP-dependent transcriptional regulator
MVQTIGAQEVQQWLETWPVYRYPRNAVIFVPDQPADTLFILDEGGVKLSWTSSKGREKTLEYVLPGCIFGVVGLLQGRSYGIVASTTVPSRIGRMPRAGVLTRIREDPGFAEFLTVALADKVRSSSRQVVRFAMYGRSRKVVSGLLDLMEERLGPTSYDEQAVLAVTHQELADYVGTNRVSVTMVLGQLESEGLVEKRSKAIVIPAPRALSRWLGPTDATDARGR